MFCSGTVLLPVLLLIASQVLSKIFFKGLFSVVRRIITVVLHCNLVLSVAVGFSRLQEGFLSKFLWMEKLCHARGSDL